MEPEPDQEPEIPVDKPTKSPEIVVTPPNTDEPLNTSEPELSSELETLSSVDFTNPEYPDLEVDFNTLHQSEIALFPVKTMLQISRVPLTLSKKP